MGAENFLRGGWLLGLALGLAGCGVSSVAITPGLPPLTLRGRTRGVVDSGVCGYLGRRPNHQLRVREDVDYLKLQVTSPAATTLWVKGSDGAWCGAPIQTRPAEISGYWQAGVYDIFIGTPRPRQSLPYQLRISGAR